MNKNIKVDNSIKSSNSMFMTLRKRMKLRLWQAVLVAMSLGIMTGLLLGPRAGNFQFLGNIFLNLIKMVTVPLIFFTLIYGIIGIRAESGIWRVSARAISMFVLTSSIAVVSAISLATWLKPGANFGLGQVMQHMGIDPSGAIKKSAYLIQQGEQASYDKGGEGIIAFLNSIPEFIPNNIFLALSQGTILQIIVLAFFIGIVLNKNREKCQNIIILFEEAANLFFKIIETLMYIAPFGVFGYMASLVGNGGGGVLLNMARLIGTILLACTVQYLIYGLIIMLFTRLSPFKFYKKILTAQLMAFSTSSSKATLPLLMEVAENKLGISKANTRFLLPLSAALNMDGGAIYQSACAIFFAQVFQHNLQMVDYVILLFTCTLASVGGAGIPGGVLIFLGMVLHSIGLPLESVLIVASIDRILDMFTTALNVTGGACNTLVVDSQCGSLDVARYNK